MPYIGGTYYPDPYADGYPPSQLTQPSSAWPYLNRDAINAAAKQYMGRELGEEDWYAHRGNPGGTQGVIDTIRTSDEARQYAASLANTNAAGGTSGAGYTGGAGTFAVAGDTTRGGQGADGWAMSGFDFAQDAKNRDISKSAKYAFAEAARQAKAAGVSDIWKTKAGAQYFAEQYVAPFLNSAGFKVGDIVGDKMQVTSPEGTYWIDFVINADGDNPALAWQAEQSQAAWADFPTSKFDTSAYGSSGSTGTGMTNDQTGYAPPNAMNADAYAELARWNQRYPGVPAPQYITDLLK